METKKIVQNSKLSIGVFGIGAIGSVLSYLLLTNNNLNLKFYNRSFKRAIRIKSDALNQESLGSFSGTYTFSHSITCQTKFTQNDNLDWLLLCLKEHHFTEAKPFLKQLITTNTKVAVIRNGLRLKDPLLDFVKEENILECIIDCPCQPSDNGFYEILGFPKISIPKGPLAESFSHLFAEESIIITQIDDFKTASWKKLCESSALGGLLAVHRETCRIFENPDLVETYKKVLNEAIAVAKADGAKIENDFANLMLEKLLAYPKNKGSSMLTDLLLGKPIELGAKNGVIVKLGKSYDIQTPLNDWICEQLK